MQVTFTNGYTVTSTVPQDYTDNPVSTFSKNQNILKTEKRIGKLGVYSLGKKI